MRWIAHVDMDSFFVSVERLQNRSLEGKPVVVGGQGPRAVVASASYEARKFGVRSAMPTSQARRLCPSLVIVPPRFSEYSRISRLIFTELEKLAPVVEQVSIDEAYLDFTGCERIYRSREESAQVVKNTIKRVSHLTSTVGISTSKLVSKIASDHAKPNGLLVVPTGKEVDFLAPLSVRKLPGVGQKTGAILEALNIKTCADLARRPIQELRPHLGNYVYELQQFAQGIDSREVSNDHERKSLGSEETFDQDVGDIDYLCDLLRDMSEELAADLRFEALKARTIQIKIRYPDFTTHTRAKTIENPTDMATEISKVAQALLHQHKDPSRPLRLLGVSVRNFVESGKEQPQLNLFENASPNLKEEKVEKLKDEIKQKFGKNALVSDTKLKKN